MLGMNLYLWLHLQRRLAGDQRNRLLLRILGVHLNDRQIRCARRNALHHDAHQRAATAYPWGVGLARGGNDGLPSFFIDALHDANVLRPARKKTRMPGFPGGELDFFDADYRGVVLHQERNRKEIVYVIYHNTERLLDRKSVV